MKEKKSQVRLVTQEAAFHQNSCIDAPGGAVGKQQFLCFKTGMLRS